MRYCVQFDWKVQIISSFSVLNILSINYILAVVIIIIIIII
jgi:hypothetical protein